MFSLTTSEAISTLIKEKYKQVRHSDDENQPLSVQPWGLDGDKRRYFLIQGLDDTSFRVYREGSRYTKNAHWYSMAGEIDELRALAKKLEDVDGTQAARRLAGRIAAAIPVFEGSEEVRLQYPSSPMDVMLMRVLEAQEERVQTSQTRSFHATLASSTRLPPRLGTANTVFRRCSRHGETRTLF